MISTQMELKAQWNGMSTTAASVAEEAFDFGSTDRDLFAKSAAEKEEAVCQL